jgi:hypothetical protein
LPSDDDAGDVSEIFLTPVDEQLVKNKIDIVKRNFFIIYLKSNLPINLVK